MSIESDRIEQVVTALSKVPEKKLLIIKLVNQIPITNGQFDYLALSSRRPEMNLAITEAKVYGTHTIQTVDVLSRVKARED